MRVFGFENTSVHLPTECQSQSGNPVPFSGIARCYTFALLYMKPIEIAPYYTFKDQIVEMATPVIVPPITRSCPAIFIILVAIDTN